MVKNMDTSKKDDKKLKGAKDKKSRIKNAHLKDILREISNTWKRFLSILIMTALGVFILVGLKVTGPKMRDSIERHIVDQNMYDLIISSPVGINDEDMEALKKITGVKEMDTGYYTDIALGGEKINFRVSSLSDRISVPEIKEGRLPEKFGEIAVEYTPKTDGIKIGQKISFEKESDKLKEDKDRDDLKTYEFTVVGKVISTDYLIQANKGVSEISTGTIDTVAYVTKENFDKDVFSFVKYTFKSTEGVNSDSDKYENITSVKKSDAIEILEPRASIKFAEIKEKNQRKIDDASKEIRDGRKELQDAEDKLADAKKKLEDGKKKLANAESELKTKTADANKKLADGAKEIEDGKKKLKDAEEKYLTGKKEYEDGLEKYNEALKNSGLEEKKAELNDNKEKVAAGLLAIAENKSKLEGALSEIEGIEAQLNYAIQKKTEANLSHIEEDYKLAEVLKKKEEATAGLEEVQSKEAELEINKNKIEEGLSQIETAEEELNKNKEKLDVAKKELETGKAEIEKNKEKLKKAEKDLADGRITLNRELKDANEKIRKAKVELQDGEKEYNENNEKFISKKAEVLETLDEGEKKINDAKEMIDKLNEPKFKVETRKDNDSLFFMIDSSHKLDIVSWIFPLFFFFVAILVSLTTMTRMVEEKRIEIGTYKALGFSTASISMKYISYGLISSLIGGIIGATFGSVLLPKIIYHAYSASFVIKELTGFVNPFINIVAILFGVLVNMLATLSVVLSSLRENAASLMRPKPPKKVKKMLIEKIKFIWNRLGFIGKVTMRNVFRYKSRMFMTIFGIAGCTGLLFLGFSLREALGGIESRQFEKIMKYDFQIVTDEMLGDEGKEDYLKFLKSDDVKGYMNAYTQSFTYENENGRDQQVALVVPENKEEFDEYIELFVEKQFKKDRYYELDGVMITKKLGEIRPRGKSDIELRDSDLVETKIIPDGVVDNYIGHFVFMPKEIYEQKFNKKYETNSYYIKLNDLSKKDSIIADLRKNKSILSVVDFTEGKMAIDNWTTSVAAVVYIIIICSSILAMVVLYNLSNINIEERKRELSTIKVLGFTNKELSEYIYRETYILTVIGILAGFLVGWGMLIAVAEILPPDNIILNTIISFRPYLYSALISLFFTFVVEFIVRRRLKTIDMVSSLKAYE